MYNYFENQFNDINWQAIGQIVSPALNPLASQIYPMSQLTAFHYAHHIPGLTGRWMDTLPGHLVSGGFYHRIHHGHQFFSDGFKVLTNSELKFGEFVHHLGMDFLTKQGIPVPILPAGTLFNGLRQLGLSASTANELLTINLSKLLGGSLSIVTSGSDVWACFADTIPHTWTAAAWHCGLGVYDCIWGCFPPNPFILLSGGAEVGVGITTGVRTLIDTFHPAVQTVTDTSSVLFPCWLQTASISALLGACIGYWNGQSYSSIAKGAGITLASSATAAAVGGAFTGNFIAPFIGGAAGFLTGLLLRKIIFLNSDDYEGSYESSVTDYFAQSPYFQDSHYWQSEYFGNGVVIPIMQLPKEPIGQIKNGTLTLDPRAIQKSFAV